MLKRVTEAHLFSVPLPPKQRATNDEHLSDCLLLLITFAPRGKGKLSKKKSSMIVRSVSNGNKRGIDFATVVNGGPLRLRGLAPQSLNL